MKILIGIVVCTSMVTLSACGPNARYLEVQRLAKVVETLQGQMVAQDQRIESLTNKMIVLKQSRSQDNSGPSDVQPELQVVTLQPDEPFESEQESEEPIVLRLRGTPEKEVLPVVAVAPAPVIQNKRTPKVSTPAPGRNGK